jgi:hypothetical protein
MLDRWRTWLLSHLEKILGRTDPCGDRDHITAQITQCALAYQAGAYSGPVSLIRAQEQPRGIEPDPTMGWKPFCSGNFAVTEVPGFHATILFEDPVVQLLADALRKALP